MEGIEEYTFLIDPEARVVELNRSAIVLFGSGGETGSKRLLESLFADADGLRAKLEGLRNSGASQLESGVVALKEDEGTTLLRASFHLVRDKWGDAVGYVAIARDWDQIAAVSSRYRLSERESQVLSFILSGVQQKEMADQLCLSLPTIKSHTTSLYNKLGVGSRGEVWALCASDDKPAPARVL
jgi:DNA-binding CsgD family transcriptional regulator